MTKPLLIATHNKGKLHEFKQIFTHRQVIGMHDVAFTSPEEDGDNFIDNALIKARNAYNETYIAALADDSGLNVHALHGAPGIYSARWAGDTGNFTHAMGRVWQELKDYTDKTAHFTCALAYKDSTQEIAVEGNIYGHISWPMRGDNGFGYDAIFIPDGYDITFAEMTNAQKNIISHRTEALKKLQEYNII